MAEEVRNVKLHFKAAVAEVKIIVCRYDIILILEVVDVTGAAVRVFMEELNRVCTTHHYTIQLSARLGRSRYKEQFLFLYRDDVMTLIDSYQYEDQQANDVDVFAREPYILHFKPHNTAGMRIASFNVQRFGLSKVSNPDVLSTLVKIVCRYDIILILEVVDVTGAAVRVFMEELNRVCTTHHYTIQLSARLGRSRYKEQFLFLYRDDVMTLIDSYQYEDQQANDVDVFAREPYILHFKPHNTVLKDIVLIPVHTTPRDSEKELDELYDVFLVVKDKWKTDNIMILGDFNADGAYLTGREMKDIRIRKDRNFHWLIGDEVDTTANTSNEHTYDRIVVYGDDMLAAIVPNSATTFNFHKEFRMTEEKALQVSDHYPVEVELLNSTRARETQEICSSATEELKMEVLQLQKENLQLEREKLQLQISLLKQRLSKTQFLNHEC